jgi:hypothetical protein
MTNKQDSELFKYELRDISKYASADPRGAVESGTVYLFTEDDADEKNYARALNGNPLRLIKMD